MTQNTKSNIFRKKTKLKRDNKQWNKFRCIKSRYIVLYWTTLLWVRWANSSSFKYRSLFIKFRSFTPFQKLWFTCSSSVWVTRLRILSYWYLCSYQYSQNYNNKYKWRNFWKNWLPLHPKQMKDNYLTGQLNSNLKSIDYLKKKVTFIILSCHSFMQFTAA